MKYARNQITFGTVAAAVLFALPLSVSADAAYDALKSQVEALQKQLQQVEETLKQYEAKSASKQEVATIKDEVAEVSAKASEWTNTDSVVHLAGYGAVTYSDSDDENGAFSGVQFNPIFHYQYKDLLMLEAELELEVDEHGETELALEYLTGVPSVSSGRISTPPGSISYLPRHPGLVTMEPLRYRSWACRPVAASRLGIIPGLPTTPCMLGTGRFWKSRKKMASLKSMKYMRKVEHQTTTMNW